MEKSTKKHFSRKKKNTPLKKKHKETLLFFKNTHWEDCKFLCLTLCQREVCTDFNANAKADDAKG